MITQGEARLLLAACREVAQWLDYAALEFVADATVGGTGPLLSSGPKEPRPKLVP
jgi:hypothetical protein